jgi:hypothetical protein
MKPTDKQVAEAWLTIKAAGIYSLLSITVDEIIDASENTVTEEKAKEAAELMQAWWDVSDDWQAAIEHAIELTKGHDNDN